VNVAQHSQNICAAVGSEVGCSPHRTDARPRLGSLPPRRGLLLAEHKRPSDARSEGRLFPCREDQRAAASAASQIARFFSRRMSSAIHFAPFTNPCGSGKISPMSLIE